LTYEAALVDELGVGSLCLSVALPVQTNAYGDNVVERWVRGILPEGETLSELERRFGIARGDSFGLLEALGYDCAGAISVVSDEFRNSVGTSGMKLTEVELASAIEDLPSLPLGVDEEVRVSLGGLQAKLLLCRTADGWERPAIGVPTTHILKPDPPEFPGLVASEFYAMRLAGEAGLLVANVELDEIGGRSVLIVERFDRRVVNGVVTRIHQEDGCQALGLDPEREKYQKPGQLRPSYEALAHVLSSHAVNPVAQLRALGECMVLTAAVANTDGHARNHSFLIEDGALTFAPIYDVAPTMAFVPADTVALAVAGEKKMARITRLRLAVEMQSWGLTGAEAKIVVNDTIDRVLDALNHVDPSSAPTRSVEAINNRARSLNAS
jgi:serine/threonine-protein kinase HipA